MVAGGRWECREKRRVYNQRRIAEEKTLERRRELWHAPDGGWLKRRRKELGSQRAQIEARLVELGQEAAALVSLA